MNDMAWEYKNPMTHHFNIPSSSGSALFRQWVYSVPRYLLLEWGSVLACAVRGTWDGEPCRRAKTRLIKVLFCFDLAAFHPQTSH